MKTIIPDRVVLHGLYGDSRISLIEIFSEFLTSYPKTRKSLISAFDSGNLTSLKRVLQYHAPSFMYIGMPDLTARFKTLSLKCSKADSHYSLANDFAELMIIVEESWMLVKKEMENIENVV